VGKYIHGLTVEERFWQKVEPEPNTGCWLWTGGLRGSGRYGQFRNGKRLGFAHRYAYELLVGPIPDGMQLDHLCRVRLCVNPAHLEPVTARENTMRSEALTARNARKTHCLRGHPFDEANTIETVRDGRLHRTCRECDRSKSREWQRAQRGTPIERRRIA
jgi:hypothetical protein